MTFPLGEWKLDETPDGLIVVLAYEAEAAFAYLWPPDQGVLAHAWLFNTGGETVAAADTVPDEIPLPLRPGDISCRRRAGIGWDIRWGGQTHARLLRDHPVGLSRFVTRDTPLARVFPD